MLERIVEGTVGIVSELIEGRSPEELSFKKKLAELRDKRMLEWEKSRAHEKEEKRRKAPEFERLSRIAKKELLPILKTVNKSYLRGKGRLSLEEAEDCEIPTVFWELSWGDSSDDEIPGPRLWARLDQELNVSVLGGGFFPKFELNLNVEGWEEQLKEGVLRILSFPRGCSWKRTEL